MSRALALTALVHALRARKYHFITPTPLTHAGVIARRATAGDLRGVFGWSLPFAPEVVGDELLALMRAADVVEQQGAQLKSTVRVSSLDDLLFLHSAYPTTQNDAVFFGPDSYRYATFLRAEIPAFGKIGRLVDIGTGSGIGLIAAMLHAQSVGEAIGADINARALEFAQANSGATAEALGAKGFGYAANIALKHSSGLSSIDGPLDVVIANPPYILDDDHRAYRDGGAMHGAALSLDWAKQAAEKLRVGGALLLYTGSAIVGGVDVFERALREALPGFEIRYREIDPDVFGEELERDAYADVERIAVVGVVAVKR